MKSELKGWKQLNGDIMKPSNLATEYYYNFIFNGISNYKTLYKTYIKTELIQKEKEGHDIEDFFFQLNEIINKFIENINEYSIGKVNNSLNKARKSEESFDDFLEISLTELSKGKYVGSFYFYELNEFVNSLNLVYHEYITKALVILKDTKYDFYEIKRSVISLSKLPEDESPYIFLKTLYKEVKLSVAGDSEALGVFLVNFYDLIKEYSSNFVFENHKAEIKEWFKNKYDPLDIELLWRVKKQKNKKKNDRLTLPESQSNEIKLEEPEWKLYIKPEVHKLIEDFDIKLKDKITKWKDILGKIECAAFCEMLFERKYFVPKSTRIKTVNSFSLSKYGVEITIQLQFDKKVDRLTHKMRLKQYFL